MPHVHSQQLHEIGMIGLDAMRRSLMAKMAYHALDLEGYAKTFGLNDLRTFH